MSYQLSVWLDDQSAKDLEALSRLGERRRGAMVKVLIRRAARELAQAVATADERAAAAQPAQRRLRAEAP